MFTAETDYDTVVVGGGVAGLSAALVLGRARRRALLTDTGTPRNAPASESHGFLTRDGMPPLELRGVGREQLSSYETIVIRDAGVTDAVAEGTGFRLQLANQESVTTATVLLATGVVDQLPQIEGFQEYWGGDIFHCPYCHGFEVRDRPLAIYANGDRVAHMAAILRGWSDDIAVCTGGPATFCDTDRALLQRHAIQIYERPVARFAGTAGRLEAIEFDDGTRLARSGIFYGSTTQQRSDLAQRLGCTLAPEGHIVVDHAGLTSVPGVYAAGDIIDPMMHQIVYASASGARAAAGITNTLLHTAFVGAS